MSANSKHWHRRVDEQSICWLTLDKAGATVNTLSSEVMAELAQVIDDVEHEHRRVTDERRSQTEALRMPSE